MLNLLKIYVKPRYIRINTHLFSIEKAKTSLQKQGWQFKKHPIFDNYQNFLKEVGALSEHEYMMDMHVDNLLIFHPKTKNYWALHKYVKTRQFLLQDKGTCLVGELLRPPFDATVLDMCAAPGMKTIHLSNIMQNRGKIYAVEQNQQRYELLSKLIREAGCKNVETILADVLSVSSTQCPDVDYILVDPSCSGSGIQSRISIDAEEKDPKRLHKLAGLQIKILSHAMASFPKAKRIIYSTCSEYKEENEVVVHRCLQINPNFKLLCCRKRIRNKWHNLNSNFSDISRSCLSCCAADDLTDGIFIALFQKCK